MVNSLISVGTAVLALAGNAAARKYNLAETYDHTNFFSKFNFFESRYGTGNINDVDGAHGHVMYQSQANAQKLGLISSSNDGVYIGVDHKTFLKGNGHPGRPSVRIESKSRYNHGLIIARFTHLPEVKCGVWPAFWTYGNNWPNDGEIDIYEEWNESPYNQPTFHTANSAKLGNCVIDGSDMSGTVSTGNCDNGFQSPPKQYLNQGCAAVDHSGVWGSSTGGVYAVEWTSDYIKIFSWPWSKVPANVASSTPDPSAWGKPVTYLKGSKCAIDKHFANQKIVLNIDFCGEPAGFDSEWKKTCAAKTGQKTCIDFVSGFPNKFANSYFKVKDIRYFK